MRRPQKGPSRDHNWDGTKMAVVAGPFVPIIKKGQGSIVIYHKIVLNVAVMRGGNAD